MIGVMAALAACAESPAAPRSEVQVTVMRQTDTIRFSAPVTVARCAGRPGVLVEAIESSSGVLVWLRTADSTMAGTYRVVGMRDTISRPAAVVSVRFLSESVPYTVSLDSGTVATEDSAGALRLRVQGSGLDVRGGTRPGVDAIFDALQAPNDSVTCVPGP